MDAEGYVVVADTITVGNANSIVNLDLIKRNFLMPLILFFLTYCYVNYVYICLCIQRD